ncbi:MAG TPA: PAC2 family protein [Candidatus Sulfomarinibacteraceae bacterium]|nr:PAC2 family protein [Candidatus Sulfomarinibacteraceae bacterium]
MSDVLELWEQPDAENLYMIAGWRQWADAGSISSGLPRYLIQETGAHKIGALYSDDFYLFQIPGTHDLVRPVVRFEEGYPESLEERQNELYYTGDEKNGIIIFLGDEPHLYIERYLGALLDTAQSLGVKRIIGLGGVYGELPYDKERLVSSVYSVERLKPELEALAVTLSDYHGGASIGSYLCRRAGDRDLEYVGFYGFVPTYDFSNVPQIGNAIRIENDYTAWLGVMRRLNYMLELDFDLADLENKSERLVQVVDAKVEELDDMAPQLEVRDYLARIEEEFTEVPFEPLDDVWEEELRRLFDEDSEAGD